MLVNGRKFQKLGSIFNKTGLRKRCKNLFYSILHCLVLIAIGWEHPPCSNLIHSTWPLVTSINFSNAWRLVSISLYWALIAAAHSDAKWSNSSNEFSESSLEPLSSAPAFTPGCFPSLSHVPKLERKKLRKWRNYELPLKHSPGSPAFSSTKIRRLIYQLWEWLWCYLLKQNIPLKHFL